MKKILSFLMLVIMCITVARAQGNGMLSTSTVDADKATWKGLRFSYDHATERYTGKGNYDGVGFNGFSLGYVQAFRLGRKLPLFLETGAGVNFLRHCEDESEDDYVEKYSVNLFSLSVPVNVVYKFDLTDKVSIKPYTGLYLRLNLMAKEKEESGYTGKTAKESYNMFDGDNGLKRVQLGWNVGVTLDYSRYNIGIGYALDFNEIEEESKFGTLSIRLGMNF